MTKHYYDEDTNTEVVVLINAIKDGRYSYSLHLYASHRKLRAFSLILRTTKPL